MKLLFCRNQNIFLFQCRTEELKVASVTATATVMITGTGAGTEILPGMLACTQIKEYPWSPKVSRGTIPRMRPKVPTVLLLLALVTILLTIFGDQSFAKLTNLQENLAQQKMVNNELSKRVYDMKREVAALQSDPLAVERAARTTLGMAKKGDIIVFFDETEKKTK